MNTKIILIKEEKDLDRYIEAHELRDRLKAYKDKEWVPFQTFVWNAGLYPSQEIYYALSGLADRPNMSLGLRVQELDHPMAPETTQLKIHCDDAITFVKRYLRWKHNLPDYEFLAEQLLVDQQKLNDRRGMDCVRTIALFLKRGLIDRAKACCFNEADKLQGPQHKTIRLKLIQALFGGPRANHPWKLLNN